MSKHNYSQYSKPNRENRTTETAVKYEPNTIATTPTEPTPEIAPVVETVETVTLPEAVKGTVVGCNKLNVRERASITAPIVTVISAGSEVEIDTTKSIDTWLHVCTATGVEGYCMGQYINVRL